MFFARSKKSRDEPLCADVLTQEAVLQSKLFTKSILVRQLGVLVNVAGTDESEAPFSIRPTATCPL
jgi:hypothetical protein